MRSIIKKTTILTVLCLSVVSFAAIPVRQALSEKKEAYLDSGVFVGGRDRGPLTLFNFRRSMQKAQKMERMVFDVGQVGETTGRPGFFHIALQKNPQRLVVDLENVTQSKITVNQINQLLKASPYISKAVLFTDPRHKSTTIEFPLKTPVDLEVFELIGAAGKPGRIVLDIKPSL